jgi:hypothetical protein
VASSYLDTGGIQDLADQIGEIRKAAVGYDLKVMVRIEVGAEGKRPPDQVVSAINQRLTAISPALALRLTEPCIKR